MPIQSYLDRIHSSLASGHATEHTYRPELRDLFVELSWLQVINEPKGSEHGKPDFIFLDNIIPVAYGEAKDMHIGLEKIEKSEQLSRYFWYAKLILTNGIEFRFYKNGIRYGEPIFLATKTGTNLQFHEESFGIFRDRLADFLASPADTIRRATHLAEIMGGKARRIRDNLREMMQDESRYEDIWRLYRTFKTEILHDLTTYDFADLYAQTLVYGLFVARYHDTTPETFSRGEALDLVPRSNPLLRTFFDHIAGAGYEKRLEYIVDELCEVFAHANVASLMHGVYQKETHDPVIHFYEDFLGEYDSDLRMARGVFYTPAPVVKFIIRAVDDVLRTHFWLAKWLADTSKIQVEREIQKYDKKWERKTETIETHRVQILDPATGTGTFLDEIVRYIYAKMQGQAGMWPSYVNQDLLPRLHGFELMMASYTIAHLKLGLTLAETGVTELDKRLQIYLTNSLEQAKTKKEDQWTLFWLLESITDEARQADEVKRDKPIMVIVGNPPYSGESTNKWVFEKELDAYKQEPGGGKLQEKNSKWLNDDYVKFFRFAESLIEKNNDGVLGFITNHSYLDNPTFRGMRWHLLQTFDYIYLVDLHGNSKKKETTPDGGKDENVFDIQQGTAIFIWVKTGKKKPGELAEVFHIDQYGKRQAKYDWLENNDIFTGISNSLNASRPFFEFKEKNIQSELEYGNFFWIKDLFKINVLWFQTHRDNFAIAEDFNELERRINDFIDSEPNERYLSDKFWIKSTWDWSIIEAHKKVINIQEIWGDFIVKCSFRPFDERYCYFNAAIIDRTRSEITKNIFKKENISLIIPRQNAGEFRHIFCSKLVCEANLTWTGWTNWAWNIFPLYLYSDSENLDGTTKTPNLDAVIWTKINENIGRETTPEEILDYIYAVLHSPSYREKYREFLKIDFPRVPYPASRESLDALVRLGGELRALHLLESPKVEEYITTFPIAGSGEVEKIRYETVPVIARDEAIHVSEVGNVWINAEQYFGDVPEVAWNFYIGGYQPAQKWLKDRKWMVLTWEDISHYQSMIVALTETARVMGEIDEVLESNGK